MFKSEKEIREDIAKLEKKVGDIDAKGREYKRELTEAELSLKNEIIATVKELRKELPEPRMTLENFSYDAHGNKTTGSRGTELNPRTYRGMFYPSNPGPLDTGDFRDASEFIRVIDSGRYDPRLEARAQGEGIPSAGGFSVPVQFASEWLDASLPKEIARNLCRVFPMQSESLQVAGWDGKDMSAGKSHGGFEMEFLAEHAAGTKQQGKLRRITLTAKMGAIFVDVSIELIQDGRGFAENLQTALVKSIGYGIDKYCIRGVGAGQPLGCLNAGCAITVVKESGQRPDTLVYSNLKKMFARQLNPDNSVWLFNSSTTPELLEQSVAVGVGGSFVPLLNETSGKFSIFGRPVYFTPHMSALGDAGDAAFIDFSFYALGLRQDVFLDWTDAHRWAERERSFRVIIRLDGQPTLDSAITPEHGETLSPIVILGERA